MQDTFTRAKTSTGPHKTLDWVLCGPQVGHNCSIALARAIINLEPKIMTEENLILLPKKKTILSLHMTNVHSQGSQEAMLPQNC